MKREYGGWPSLTKANSVLKVNFKRSFVLRKERKDAT